MGTIIQIWYASALPSLNNETRRISMTGRNGKTVRLPINVIANLRNQPRCTTASGKEIFAAELKIQLNVWRGGSMAVLFFGEVFGVKFRARRVLFN